VFRHSLYAMGDAILEEQPGIAEIRFSLPNKHHFVIDLSRFGVENKNEVLVRARRYSQAWLCSLGRQPAW
jgi:urate oxidase